MSRAAILPFPGDPFLLNYWLKFFDEFWADEIDKLYIYLNSPIEQCMVNYIRDLCSTRPKIKLIYNSTQIEHGECINRCLNEVMEDHIMLIEDDGFIFKKGIVDTAFTLIENGTYEIVGSKRGSCGFEILQQAQKKWGLNYEGYGDQGCNFWPCFFFCKKSLLLKTDRNFGATCWKAGEKIEWLDNYECVTDQMADTFVNTSLQLLNLVPLNRIKYLPQYHGSPDDLQHFEYKSNLFDGICPWVHVGSLSSGVGGILRDDRNRQLSRRTIDLPEENTELPKQWCQSEGEHHEFERRVQWWLRFYEYAKPTPEIKEFYDLYGQAVHRIIRQFGLSIKRIRARQRAYSTLGL